MAPDAVDGEEEVLDVLGPVAAWIHAHQPTGLATEAEIRQQVTRSRVWRGLDPSNLPGSFKHDVNDFLEVVRRDSGLLLARVRACIALCISPSRNTSWHVTCAGCGRRSHGDRPPPR